MKDIEFKDAYCVNYEESWADPEVCKDTKELNLAHIEIITITCKVITNQSVTYKSEPEDFAAILYVSGFKERQVFNVSYSFSQATDKDGLTTGIARGGKIKLTVKAMNDGNCELLNWMCDSSLSKSGKIAFKRTDDLEKDMKDIEFEDAFCVDFVESWEDPDSSKAKDLAHTETITITCKKITNQSVKYDNIWD